MSEDACCELGRIVRTLADKNEVAFPLPGFTLNRFQGESQRPRFVLQIDRHVLSLSDLTDAERADFGRALAVCVQAIQESPGVEKVYIESYNETPPGHVHIHLIPRFSSDTEHLGPNLPASADIPDGFRPSDVLAALANPTGKGRKSWRDSPLTDAVRSVLNFWNKWLSPYPLVGKFARWRLSRTGQRVDAGELYVLGWFILLSTMCALAAAFVLPQMVMVLLAVVATFRWIDLSVFVANILLTTSLSILQSLARSLVLFTVNVLELLFIGFLWQRGAGSGRGAALNRTFGVGTEAADSTLIMDICAKAIEISLVLVVGLAIAMVIGKIGNTFHEAPRVSR
jgi:diadenosine tetraphosphate (Ap4A) HIT family hydrolase